MSNFKLTPTQYKILKELENAKVSLFPSQIAQLVGISHQTSKQYIRILFLLGLVDQKYKKGPYFLKKTLPGQIKSLC
jgi:predicted transcriptional regulator